MTRQVPLSEFQYKALESMGIDLWVPRRDLPLSGPVKWRIAAEVEVEVEVEETPRERSMSDSPTLQRQEKSSESDPAPLGPAIRFQSLSLQSRECHVLIDDATYAETAFWTDFLRSLQGFTDRDVVRERRFDWPLPGLMDASAEAAQKALRGYLSKDGRVCVRGDAIANLLLGAGTWHSFPESHRHGGAEIWVFGSDLDLKDVGVRRAIWQSIVPLELG